MNEQQVQKLWDLHANKAGFTDINEFRSFMNDPSSRKQYFDLSNKDLGFKDFSEFEDVLEVKKKEPSQYGSFPEPWKSPSQPQVGNPLSFPGGKRPLTDQETFSLVKRRKELSQKKVEDPRTATMFGAPKSGGNVSAADIEKATNEIASIDQRFAEAGYDPKKLDFLADFEAPTNIKEALKAKETNPEFLDRKIAATNWQAGLYNNINKKLGKDGKAVFNTLIDGQYSNNFEAQSRGTRDAIASVYQFSDNGDEQKKIIENIKKDREYGYGIGLPGVDEAKHKIFEQYPHLNDHQQTALLYLRDVDPETAKAFEATAGMDLSKQRMGAKAPEVKLGWEDKARELEVIGMGIQARAIREKLNSMKAKGDLSQDEVAQYNGYVQRLNEIKSDSKSQVKRYPGVAELDANERMQEAYKQTNGAWKRFFYGMGDQFNDGLNVVASVSSAIFGGESSLADLEQLGNARITDNQMYKTKENTLTPSDLVVKLPEDIQKQIDELKTRTDVSDDQKAQLIEDIYKNNADKVTMAVDPTARKLNITAGSFFNGLSDLGSQLVPQLALAYVTSGASLTGEIPAGIQKVKELSNLFGSTFALAYNDHYTQALRDNNPHPSQYALVNTSIDAASELLNSDFDVVRRMSGGTLGKVLNTVTKADWEKLVGRQTRFQLIADAIKKTGKTSLRNAAGETYEEIVGGVTQDLANNQLFGQDYDLMKTIRENGVNTFLPMLGFGALSLPFNYRNNSTIHKYALYEAGANYDKYVESNAKALENDEISKDQFNTRSKMLEGAKKAYDAVPETKPNGDLLTDNEKAEYAHLQFVQQQTKERIKEASTETAERMKAVVEEINTKKEEILSGPKQDNGLETEVKDIKNDYLAEPELFNVNIDNHNDTEVSIKVQDPKTGEMVDKNYKAVEVKRVLKNRSERLQEIFTCLTS